MKIYTRKGDQGQTSLLGGTRLPKHDLRIGTYGTVDELNAHIGLIRDQDIDEATISVLTGIQDRLFTLGATLASDPEKSKMKLPRVTESDVEFLEKEMDRMNETLPEMKSFILPGGHTTVSFCHVARCVCRRAERLAVLLGERSATDPIAVKYLNRLSDYLFVLARKLSKDLGVKEIPWHPRT